MPKSQLRAGAQIDVLSQEELAAELDRQVRQLVQEAARGVGTFQLQDSTLISGGVAILPSGSSLGYGPEPGFCWAVQRISVYGLATNDVVGVYREVTTGQGFVGQVSSSSPVYKPGSRGLILRAGQRLILSGAALAATGYISVNAEGIELPETDLYKLL